MGWIPSFAPYAIILSLSGWLLFRYIISPYLVGSFTNFRLNSFSIRSVRGVEWRFYTSSVVPTLRIERIWIGWGGTTGLEHTEQGLFVLNVEGISIRPTNEIIRFYAGGHSKKPDKPPSKGKWKARVISYALHMIMNHYPAIARLISLNVCDIRVIFDEMDGMEVILGEYKVGVRVDFVGSDPHHTPNSPVISSPSTTSSPTLSRNNPLAPTGSSASPPPSPTIFTSFFQPFTIESTVSSPIMDEHSEQSFSRFGNARRTASMHYSKVSTSANQIWSRAIGRAHGSLSGVMTFKDFGVILPNESAPPPPVSARPSIPELRSSTGNLYGNSNGNGTGNGLNHRGSVKSLREAQATPRVFDKSHQSFNNLFNRAPRYGLHHDDGGFEKLFELSGSTKSSASVGFGPKKGLLGEGTLNVGVEFGNLRTNIAAIEKIEHLVKNIRNAVKKESLEDKAPEDPRETWHPKGVKRMILRALESVSVSFNTIAISHFVPRAPSEPSSATSSHTELSALHSKSNDCFTVTLQVDNIHLAVSAADSSNNDRARNAFGTNYSPESRVRGIGYSLQCQGISLNCVAPGDSESEQSQLFTMRQIEIDGFSSWRPAGWSREELLFANDPNLSLVVQRGFIAAIDVAGDVQLLDELSEAFKHARPIRSRSNFAHEESISSSTTLVSAKSMPILPPRIRSVLNIGHIMIVLADRLSEKMTTLTLESDGLHFGSFTSFNDIIASRKDKTSSRTAFKEEEELRNRRDEAGDDANYALSASLLKPQFRRKFTQVPAKLDGDYSISMRGDVTLALEPISLKMTLSGGEKVTDQETYQMLSVGRLHATAGGDVWASVDYQDDMTEIITLDVSTMLCHFDMGVDQGIKVNVWEQPVIEALVAMGNAHLLSPSTPPPKAVYKGDNLLDRLPSGVSARVSLGMISVFVGHKDPAPSNHHLKLSRGLWFQTTAIFEYAYYNNRFQALAWRHSLTSATRAKLRLPEDISTQALAHYEAYRVKEGCAALWRFGLIDTYIKPIFNASRFVKEGGLSRVHVNPETPKSRTDDDFIGWDFRKSKRPGRTALRGGEFANNISPLDISDTATAQWPVLRIPSVNVNWSISRSGLNAHARHLITSKIADIHIVSGLSHVYISLLAFQTVKVILEAWKRPKAPIAQAKPPMDLSLSVSIPVVNIHFVFPLKEQLHMQLQHNSVQLVSGQGLVVKSDHIFGYVPSAREIGHWEELAQLKGLVTTLSAPGEPLAIKVNADAFRVRIPVAYTLSKLVLNINVTIKALKLLLLNLKHREFALVKRPGPEGPKKVPPLHIHFKHVSLEAKDNPIETNLNLIWRVGMAEQETRNEFEDMFERKIALLSKLNELSSDEDLMDGGKEKGTSGLTSKATTTVEDARRRLDWHMEKSWQKRMRAAKEEQKRREMAALRHFQTVKSEFPLPIIIVAPTYTAPLFRASINGFDIKVRDPGMTRTEIIQYMSDVSAPFDPDTEFDLMLPMQLSMSFNEARVSLRDYPLPLIRIQPVEPGVKAPAFHLETPFIIAEELAHNGDDSIVLIPCDVIPAGCGSADAEPLTIQIAKTINPVKTYARPEVKISSEKTTEFTWGNSYQPAISDFMRVVETLSHPPRDPSPKIGFWDKFRLILHWRVAVDFVGPCHLHLKGSYDPYQVNGHGAGFVLAWKHNTRLLIAQPNPQHETIQISAEELLIAIPDLTTLHDAAAIGADPITSEDGKGHIHVPDINSYEETSLISRRCTKPCARFLNGVRVGFGFAFERTCRPWNCQKGCGDTENLFHRQCRFFDFEPHQSVILRSKEAVERDEQRLGRMSDSYEGFRSDFIHFSVSVVSPICENANINSQDADKHNSLHFSPKAFAHFFSWWKLFDHTLSLPIRQGPLFPDAPPPSRKFGKSLGTIKYRFDLAPLSVSHVYSQVAPELWAIGKSSSLGIKARFGHFRADAHQRAQEKVVKHAKLERQSKVIHKPFYAADLLLENILVKCIVATFNETENRKETEEECRFSKASDLPVESKGWYNYFDFIDADRKPFDKNPRIELVDVGDCPQVYFSKRNKARHVDPHEDDSSSVNSKDSRGDIETSKFGHEKSHICYLGAAQGVGPTQMRITEKRIRELELRLQEIPSFGEAYEQADRQVLTNRLNTLRKHLQELSSQETRHIDDNTLHAHHDNTEDIKRDDHGDVFFEHTCHIHCPRILWNNQSRNVLYKYFFSYRDRKKETYMTSHASLRGIRNGIQQRMAALHENWFGDDPLESAGVVTGDAAHDMLKELQAVLTGKDGAQAFRLPLDQDQASLKLPSRGIPEECIVKPKNRVLVLKPQIALRSEIEENSVVLVAVEEVSFQGYAIVDRQGTDAVSADIMARSYVFLKGMQAFYPTEETMTRIRGSHSLTRVFDFVPLEIFLDVRSEATDYDRIVLKTDAGMAIDKFNHLRLPQGLKWPEIVEANGSETNHLRIHQDLITVVLPRLTISATSRHYSALYNVVTDLLMYKDPQHRKRSERIDSFQFAFDRKDRDPARLLLDLHQLQQSIRSLTETHQGYEANLDLLTDEGKADLFRIRTDLLELIEQLFTVFEAIATNFKRDDARAAVMNSNRLDVRAGGIAWHLLQEDFKPLVKMDIEGFLMSMLTNKDGSTDNAAVINDLSALNSNAEALYPEVIVRLDTKKRGKQPIASGSWSNMPPVGGVSIYKQVMIYPTPLRARCEEKVIRGVFDYIFNEPFRKRSAEKSSKGKDKDENPRGSRGSNNGDFPPIKRTNTSSSLSSAAGSNRVVSGSQSEVASDTKFTMVPVVDAQEMKRRATASKTFIKFCVASCTFNLSYKKDENRKHPKLTMPDCVDIRIKFPELTYHNKVWGWEDVANQIKKDFISYALTQAGDYLSQVLQKSSMFRSKKKLKHIAGIGADAMKSSAKGLTLSPSRLRYTVEPPTPNPSGSFTTIPDVNGSESTLARAISRRSIRSTEESAGSPKDRKPNLPTLNSPIAISRKRTREAVTTPYRFDGATHSPRNTSSPVLGVSVNDSPNTSSSSGGGDVGEGESLETNGTLEEPSSEEEKGEEKGMGKAVKGFLGKLKPKLHTGNGNKDVPGEIHPQSSSHPEKPKPKRHTSAPISPTVATSNLGPRMFEG